jgi:predicted secreted protein
MSKSPYPTTPNLQRRACLVLATSPLLAALPVQADMVNLTLAELKALKLNAEGITLDFPPLADTGYSVPLQADIVAPAGLKVASVEVYLPENPNTRAVKLNLVEPQARYSFTTRLRLAASQDAWVVATLSDGSRRGASATTLITSSACFDGS